MLQFSDMSALEKHPFSSQKSLTQLASSSDLWLQKSSMESWLQPHHAWKAQSIINGIQLQNKGLRQPFIISLTLAQAENSPSQTPSFPPHLRTQSIFIVSHLCHSRWQNCKYFPYTISIKIQFNLYNLK